MAILAVVALAYFSNEYVGGSGYLAAFLMGLMVGNMQELGFRQYEEHEHLLENSVGQFAELLFHALQ